GLFPGPRVITDWRKDFEIRCQRAESDLEAHLVVTLARATVRDDAAAVCTGGGDEVLDDQWPADRRHQRITVHVQAVGLDWGNALFVPDRVARRPAPRLDRAAIQSPLAHRLHVLAALAEVNGHGDHLAAGLIADPADRHRRVQTAGVRQDDAIGHLTISLLSA